MPAKAPALWRACAQVLIARNRGVAEVRYGPDVTSDYAFGDYLVRVDGGVIEQFARTIATSYRVPVAWASAEFEQRKHDVVRVRIGVAADPAAAFFSGVAY
jgi:hypothetical protein